MTGERSGAKGWAVPTPCRPDASDLKARQCIDLAIRSAFPLPRTGAFKDLIAAIDAAERNVLG